MRVVVTFPTFCVAPESSSGKSEKSRQEIWAFSVLLWQQQSTTPVWLYSSSSASLKHVIKTWKPSDSVYSIRGWKRRWSFFLSFFFFWSSVTYHACVEYVGLTLSQGGPPALCRTKRKWDLLLCFLNAFFFFFFFFFTFWILWFVSHSCCGRVWGQRRNQGAFQDIFSRAESAKTHF